MGENFGEYLRELRLEKNFTLRELAQKLDVDFTYLSKLENNRIENKPSIDLIKKLSKELNADENVLTTLVGKVPSIILEQVAEDQNAMKFFRSLASKRRSSAEWKKLKENLDKFNEKEDDKT